MTRAVRASGPQVMGNAFQMRLGLLGLIPKPCFQTTQASSILMQCGTPAVAIPLLLDSTSIPGPALRGFWTPRWGWSNSYWVSRGTGKPEAPHDTSCVWWASLTSSSCFPRFSSCRPQSGFTSYLSGLSCIWLDVTSLSTNFRVKALFVLPLSSFLDTTPLDVYLSARNTDF